MKFIITEEQSEKLNHKVKTMVNKFGIKETLRLFDNNSDIIKRAYQDNPLSFLNQFNNLTPVETDDRIYYVDKDGLVIFYYYTYEKNDIIYIDYDRIWMFFEVVIGLEYSETQETIKKWLEEIYGIKGLTPYFPND